MRKLSDERNPAPGPHTASQSGERVLTTLLISDLVDSTGLLRQLGDAGSVELFRRHDRTARDLLLAHGGQEIDKTDGFLLLFSRPLDAVRYAIDYHASIATLAAEHGVDMAARIGIHLGEVFLSRNSPEDVTRGAKPVEVEGLAKPLTARLCAAATRHQILLSRSVFDIARRAAAGHPDVRDLSWVAHGRYLFQGLEDTVSVFEVGRFGTAPLIPPPDTAKARRITDDESILGWRPAPDQTIPRRENWQLLCKLGEGGFGEVWLARQRKTGEQRVYKFCFESSRLRGLRREVTLFRVLKEALGNRDDISRVIDWSFDEPPFFVESEYTAGGSIVDWAEAQGGLAQIPLDRRLELVAQVAEALGAAHSVGVLHKDMKPQNVLVKDSDSDRPQARLTDFGIGLLTDAARLEAAGITMHSVTELVEGDDDTYTTGTPLYLAPELLEGQPASLQSDIYGLGVLLYQMVAASFSRAIGPGWERDVEDPLLREDIAVLVDRSPERRPVDAAAVAQKLRSLPERRAERARAARLQAARARASRWRRALIVALVLVSVAAVATLVHSLQIRQEKQRAQHQAEVTQEVSDFLVSLFEQAEPGDTAPSQLTAEQLVDQGAERIRSSLATTPAIRARLLAVIGTVYSTLGLYERAHELLAESLRHRLTTLGSTDPAVADTLHLLANNSMNHGSWELAENLYRQSLQLVQSNPTSTGPEKASVYDDLAYLLIRRGRHAEARPLIAHALQLREEHLGPDHLAVSQSLQTISWLDFKGGDYDSAAVRLERALEIETAQQGADHLDVATTANNLAVVYRELGRLDAAEQLYRNSLEVFERVYAPDHPSNASLLNNLATILHDRHQLDAAIPLFERSLTIREAKLEATHPLIALSCNNLGRALRDAGETERARALLERALELRRSLLGDDHSATGETLYELGILHRQEGRLREAARLLQRSVSIREATLGRDNRYTRESREALDALEALEARQQGLAQK